MRALKITNDQKTERIDKSWNELVALSETVEVAAIVCLDETFAGRYMAYRDGAASLYNPVTGRFE